MLARPCRSPPGRVRRGCPPGMTDLRGAGGASYARFNAPGPCRIPSERPGNPFFGADCPGGCVQSRPERPLRRSRAPRARRMSRRVTRSSVISAVDPQVEQADHLGGVVDGPDVHPLAAARGRRPPGRGDHRSGPTRSGTWAQGTSGGASRWAAGCTAAQPQPDHLAGAQRRAQPGTHSPAVPRPAGGAENEATHTRSTAPVRCKVSRQRADGAGLLDVDVEPDVGPAAQQVLEQRDRLDAADPRRAPPSDQGSRATVPRLSVTRSRVWSWNASSTPSAVAWTSVSR